MTERLDRLNLLSEKKARVPFYEWLAESGYAEQQAANRPTQAAIDKEWATLISKGTTYAWASDVIIDLNESNPFAGAPSDYEGKFFTVSQLTSESNMSEFHDRGHWIELLRGADLLNEEGKPTQEAISDGKATTRDFFIAEWKDEGLTNAVNLFLETHKVSDFPDRPEKSFRNDRPYSKDKPAYRGGNHGGGGGGGYHDRGDKSSFRGERRRDKNHGNDY